MDVARGPFGARGSAFSARVLAEFELTDSGLALLSEACRVLDTIDALSALVDADGLTVPGSRGQTTVHPAVAEIRQQRITLSRLLRQLDLDAEEDDAEDVAPAVFSVNTQRAQHAANERWRRERAARGVGS